MERRCPHGKRLIDERCRFCETEIELRAIAKDEGLELAAKELLAPHVIARVGMETTDWLASRIRALKRSR